MRYRTVYTESFFEHASRLVGLYLLAPLLLIFSIPVAIGIAQKPDLGFSVHRLEVVAVPAGGPAARAGLRVTDRVLQVNGVPVVSMPEYYAAIAGCTSLEPVVLVVARDPAPVTLTVLPTLPSQARLIRSYSQWVTGLAFLMIGWWVHSRRPDPITRNFFALCMIFAFFLLEIPDRPLLSYMWVKERLRELLQYLLPAYFLRFFVQFPQWRRTPAGEAAKLRLLLAPGWVLFLLTVALDLIHPAPPGGGAQLVLELISVVYMVGYFLAGLVIFGRRVLRKDRPIQQSKMRVILVGLIGGLIPFLVAILLGNLTPGSSLPQWQYLAFSLLLVPTSFGLAIMRFGALDRDFVVRTSLVYGLLTAMVLVGYFVIVAGLGRMFEIWFGVSSDRLLLALVALSSLAILPLRKVVQGWIDNAFYSERRANRQAMTALADELTEVIDADDVLRTLQARLVGLFRPRGFSVFLASAADPPVFAAQPGGISGPAAADPRLDRTAPSSAGVPWPARGSPAVGSLPADSGVVLVLDRLRRPIFTEELEDLLFRGDTDAASMSLLASLDAHLLVPLVTGNRLVGFFIFGCKQGGALYSQEDLANLHGLAVQAASLIESRRLYVESLRRKRLETELQVAHDIQARLLPTGPLAGPGFEIAGRNQPSRTVGGDYFDYFLKPDGDLCFAIADVSGKGIPAALLMTSLRVSFRSEAERGTSARQVISRLNEAVAALVGQTGFVCFFFGIYKPETGILSYCNAGMDPPVLFRPGTPFRQALRLGGMVLGVDPGHPYREGTVGMQGGDRLFLYTDGLSEQRNAAGDFFEVSRLLDLVGASLDLPAEALLDRIFCSVEDFGGEEQSDDKTAILLKINILEN